ncbi:MAG TPA: tRNA (adenosine(37)-N6)-threonylcarbamoyltransferase complex dimerization subunit type 1 TsaB [Gemmatimonadaceae bacterium]|nr:tRNA (adenosine(37)-N6)-threonylcarbamoyltransferase complex dimerization subunit type 1 TsaB [Gemmatimonadaceae bacterium]
MTVLALDASTARATVAVIRSATIAAEVTVAERSEHVEPLLPAVLALLATVSVPLSDLTAIVCGAGPGTFTGLRTAASIAKGLAMGLEIPLFAVASLPLIVAAQSRQPGRYLAVLDAGRGDRFASLMNWPCAEGAGYILAPAAQVAALAAEAHATIVGPETGVWPHARGVIHLAWGPPVDLASWEPDYGRSSAAEDRRREATR